MSKNITIQERIAAIIKDALEKKSIKDKERMSATKLSEITGIKPDRMDRILNGKFARPLKREELNKIIEALSQIEEVTNRDGEKDKGNAKEEWVPYDGTPLRILNALLENGSEAYNEQFISNCSDEVYPIPMWNEQPTKIDKLFEYIVQRLFNNDYAIIKGSNHSPFPSTFDAEKELTVVKFDNNSNRASVASNLYFNFLIGAKNYSDILIAYDQMQSFFIEDLQFQCDLRDSLVHAQLGLDGYSKYENAANKKGVKVQESSSKFNDYEVQTSTKFISVFDTEEAYDFFVFRCPKLNLSSQYYAVYINVQEGVVKSYCLSHKDIGEPLDLLK